MAVAKKSQFGLADLGREAPTQRTPRREAPRAMRECVVELLEKAEIRDRLRVRSARKSCFSPCDRSGPAYEDQRRHCAEHAGVHQPTRAVERKHTILNGRSTNRQVSHDRAAAIRTSVARTATGGSPFAMIRAIDNSGQCHK